MAGNNFFSALTAHARKLYKFKQRYSLGGVNEVSFPGNVSRLHNGVCMGVAIAWLEERLAYSNSWRHQVGRALHITSKSQRDFMPDRNVPEERTHRRNSGTVMRKGAPNQLYYSAHGTSRALQQRGMNERTVEAGGAMKPIPTGPAHQPTITNFAAAMADACASERLSVGTGVVFEFNVYENGAYTGGHAAAAHRSHGNQLQFFDANIGAYQVFNVRPFFDAYEKGYSEGRHWDLQFERSGRSDAWTYVSMTA
jgi:hypothetical protein